MRAAILREVGGPLSVEDVPEPEPGDGQLLVEVRAAGINFADVLIRLGHYPQPPPLPALLGNEVAGDVDGRRVLGFVRTTGGGYAERAAVDDDWTFDLPESASYAEGASFLTTFLTAALPFKRQAHVHPGSNVLVTAAAGGVGTAAIQIAQLLGATVTAAAGSEEKLTLARELGAERTVSYEEIGELDDIDVALDPVGGPVFTACLKSLRPLGVAIGIGFAGGAWEPVDPARLVGRNTGVQGFYLGRLMGFRPELVQAEAHELLALWKRGMLRPVVGAEFPLEQANEAHELIASRKSTGKVVLVP
ncbi:MAG: zinc-binding dehydrogenase [Actinomycetota bacterium]|nr:zinc-binding dehydrogenase [Actinomycetota bacterium]